MPDRGIRLAFSAFGISFALASACTGPDRQFFDDSASGGTAASSTGGSGAGKGGKGGSNTGGTTTGAGGDTGTGTGGDTGTGTGGDTSTGTAGDTSTGTAGDTSGTAGAGGDGLPSVVVSSASVGNGATTSESAAAFDFSDNPPGTADGYECRLDGEVSFSDCTGGFDVDLLAGGLHTLEVRAFNADGTGPILERTWVVEAMGTTIHDIQTGAVPADTLVTVATNVRVTWLTAADGQTIFIQEANYINVLSDVAYRGIMTKPLSAEAPMVAGLAVSVTGSVKERSGNTAIEAAVYTRGAASAAYNPAYFDDPSDLKLEEFEGVWAQTHGTMPDFNCSSGCLMPSGVCIHSCNASCDMLAFRDVGGFSPADDAWYIGPLVGIGVGQFELWIQDYQESSDACL